MKILAKLLTGFIVVAVICGVVGVVGVVQVSNLNKSIIQLSEESIPTIQYLNDIDMGLTNLKVAIRTVVNPYGIADEEWYQRQLSNVEKYRTEYKDARSKFEAITMVPEEKKLYDVVLPMYEKAVVYNDSVLKKAAQARSATPEEREAIFADLYVMIAGEQRLVFDNLQTELRKVLEFDTQYYGVDLPKQAQAAASAGMTVLIVVTVFSFIIAAILGIVLGTSISRPLKKSVTVLNKIAAGDLSEHMESKSNDEFKQVAASINGVIANVSSLVTDAGILVQAAVDGKLNTRADASKHQGDYKKIVDGVNKTLDAVIGPLNVTAKYVDDISKGVIPPIITDSYNGDFNIIKNNLNSVVKMMSDLLKETDIIIKAAAEGELDKRANAELFQGGWNQLVRGVNDTITNIVDPLMVTADYVDKVSKGVIPPEITTIYKGQYNIIKNNLNSVAKMMSDLLTEADVLVKAAVAGRLETRADAGKFLGGWNKLVAGINETLSAVIGPLNVAAKYVEEISKGDLPPKITDTYNGDFNIIKNNLNLAIDNINALVADAGMLVQAAIEGRLATRADASKHQGDYRKIVDGVNQTLDLVVNPINETIEIMKHLAEGDLTSTMNGSYKGDFEVLKSAMNSSLDSIGETLSQINNAVDQVAEGSLQVSQASQSLSQGATEQASSLEEITSSITEIASQTKQNTESSIQMTELAKGAKKSAEAGNIQMVDLVAAMGDINASAEEIKKIVKAIDDISFQINLLALNANVEAARAGKYGKGFAVVAEEVRNLAVRSANSVKDTTRMVDEAIANIAKGNSLVDGTAKQLNEIVTGADKVASLSEEVATAGKEQSQGLDQISLGLNQIDQVTQSNTASAEESASASEELSSQSQEVKNMLAKFKLKVREGKINNNDVMQMLRSELAKQGTRTKTVAAATGIKNPGIAQRKPGAKVNPADVISLDDENFGKF